MIDLTPLDIRKKKGDFRKGMRGYEPAEVDGFLDLVAERLDELVRENSMLREKTAELTESLGHFRGRESAMNEALVSAQQLREEIRVQAERDSELRLREARAEGEEYVTQAKREADLYKDGFERLRARRDRFLRSYRSFLEIQLEELGREEERVVRARTGEMGDSEDESDA